ncbi:hypothetical protein C8Q78DRAFT_1074994 [Trametes maxima]|nr:hypothetical protein C8Q78DRAFT_1074994 [Trametes maxima]
MGQDRMQDASGSAPAAWYVRLGDKKPGRKMDQEPFLSKGGKFAPVFPIFVKVQDESQADEVLQFQEAIKIIENVSGVEEQVRLAVTLPGHNTILSQYIETTTNGLYPVAYGSRSAIFVNPQEAVAAATGTPKAIWRKVPTFGRAIAYMISKGDSEKPESALHRELLDALAGLRISTSVLVAWIEPVLQAPRANLPALSPSRRLQLFRAFVGPRDSAITPLGRLLDNGFGFNTESRLAIARACDQCSTMGEFIGAMVPQGLAALEAKFMWGLPLRPHISLMVRGARKPKLTVRREAAVNHREYHTRLARQPYKNRTRNKIQRTPAEKKLLAEKRTEARETYANALQAARETITEEAQKLQAEFGGHNEKYYEQQIFQESQATKQKRKTSKWNAYIMHKLKLLNDTLPPGAVRFKPADGTPEVQAISESWSAMSDAEKDAATCDLVKELDERKEMKSLSVQNVPITALHDTHATLNSSFEDFRRLFARTRTETVVIAVRSEPDHLTAPMTFATSGRILDFLQLSLNLSLEEIARRLEAYLLSGVPGVVDRSVQALQDDQTRVGNLILIKFRETTKIEIKKMYYTNFGSRITKKYGVVIDNWPLKTFVVPSKMRSRTELDILYNAFSSDATRFRKLTHSEWEQWLTQHGRSNEVLLGEQEDTNFDKDDEATASPSRNPEPGSSAPSLLPACSPPENALMATPSPTPPTFSPESGVPPASPSEVPIDPMLLADTTGSIRTTVAPVPPPLTTNFINTITAQDGSPLVLGASRPRKRRSDANQPHGSCKKANPSTMPIAPPTTGTPVSNNTTYSPSSAGSAVVGMGEDAVDAARTECVVAVVVRGMTSS